MTRSSANFDDSAARSSRANTHTVATPSNSMPRRVPNNASQCTSPWPTGEPVVGQYLKSAAAGG